MEQHNESKHGDGLWRKHVATAAAAYAVLVCIVCWRVFFGCGIVPTDALFEHLPWKAFAPKDYRTPGNRLLTDQIHVFYPQYVYSCERLRAGAVPLWTPHLACGQPFAASWQTAAFYPLNWLGVWLGPLAGWTAGAMSRLFLSGLVMYVLASALGLSAPGAFTAGLIYMLGSFTVVWLGHPHTNVSVLFPLLFLCIEKVFQTGRVGWAALAGVVAAFALLGGHPPTALHVAMALGAFVAYRLFTQELRDKLCKVMIIFCATVVALCLAAFQIFPFAEYYVQSSLPDVATGTGLGPGSPQLAPKSGLRLPLRTFVTTFVPNFYGRPDKRVEWMETNINGLNYNERTVFIGVIGLLLLLAAVSAGRQQATLRYWHFFLALSAVGIVAPYGVPVIRHMLREIPLVNQTFLTRMSLHFCFGGGLLAGTGLDAFFAKTPRPIRWKTVLLWCMAAGAAALAAWDGYAGASPNVKVAALVRYLWMEVGLCALPVAAFVGAVWLRRRHGLAARWLLIAALAGELALFAEGYNPGVKPNENYPTTPAIEFLRANCGGERIFALDSGRALSPYPIDTVSLRERCFPANASQVYGLRDVRGVDFTTVRSYERFLSGETGNFFFSQYMVHVPPVLGLLATRYLVIPPDWEGWLPSKYRPQLAWSGEVNIVELAGRLPRAYLVAHVILYRDYLAEAAAYVLNDSTEMDFAALVPADAEIALPHWSGSADSPANATRATPARIVVDEPERVAIEVRNGNRAMLVLADAYVSGWLAYADGKRSKVWRVNEAVRGVVLDPGVEEVEMIYRPLSFAFGVAVSMAAAAAIVAMLVSVRIKRWHQRIVIELASPSN